MQQFYRFLLLLSLLFHSLIISDAVRVSDVGGWTPIKNLNDPHVTKIAEFAVNEYNKQSKASLKLVAVVSGDSQLASGMTYRLLLKANDGTMTNEYRAVVWEQVQQDFKKLIVFIPI
ncbi:putative MO25-like protein [Hibiscus syriacus]|uniref:MO25-like protein n=1 Tax=Hibiscus syriacus TaxID=106335 RepID=A0A6A2YUQ6_HIBSY|nr:cysteine proteinase inhibitor 5-like [Hibiscus syriacus]KAE8683146.1 putative MO25-like protein [Hibiscus syriacus]